MEKKATEAIATVKGIEGEHPHGEFEIVMSTQSIDRDGEIIVKGAFDPLPASIPVHAFHDFHDPIGRATPSYDEQGRLVGKGVFAGTARAQEIRQLVTDGVIGHTSVGFMAAERSTGETGVTEIHSAELLEVSFVSIPSNRDARVLAAKSLFEKGTKGERLQSIHDLAVQNGASCSGPKHTEPEASKTPTDTTAPAAPSEDGKQPASVVTQARLAAARALLDL